MSSPSRSGSRRALILGACAAVALPLALSLIQMSPAAAEGQVLRVGGTGAALKAARMVGDLFERDHPGVTVEVVPSLGSSGGVKALLAGAIDVAFTGRPLKEEERAKGVAAQPFTRSPIVFTTPEDTAVEGVTLAAMTDIYAGRRESWPDGQPLRLVLRPQSEHDTLVLRRMSPGMDEAVEAAYARPGLLTAATDQENLDQIERLPGSLGVATLGQILAEKRALKVLALDGVRPSAAAVADGTYRHEKSLYVALPAQPAPLAAEFAAFLVSPTAQAVLAGIGGFLPPTAAGS